MELKISITLPSIFPDVLAPVIENINAATRSPHEILVVSPYEAKGDNVVWIPEEKQRGVAYAQHVAGMYATGDLVTAIADDYHYVDGWDERILPDFLEREALHGGNYAMGLRYAVDALVGTVFGMYYPNFPLMRREKIKEYGWISPDYVRGFGDGDLGMRVWNRGGTCEWSKECALIPILTDGLNTLDAVRKSGNLFITKDMELFIRRWSKIYGKGWVTTNLRGFNLDIDINKFPKVIHESGRTIKFNNPALAPHVNFGWFL